MNRSARCLSLRKDDMPVGESWIKSCSTNHSAVEATLFSSQCFPNKRREHEAGLVNLLVVVPAQLLLFFQTPTAERPFDVALCVFAADHESNAATRVWRG